MKNLKIFMVISIAFTSIANASVMLKCKSTTSVMQIQFDEESEISQPRNVQATLITKNKVINLASVESESSSSGFFLRDEKTQREFYVSRKGSKGAYSVMCTEPSGFGMMFPCDQDTNFSCKKVTNF